MSRAGTLAQVQKVIRAESPRYQAKLGVGGKPQKSQFRIDSEELTHSLIQVPKSVNKRNLHTRATQLLPGVAGQDEATPLPGQGPFYRRFIAGVIGKPDSG